MADAETIDVTLSSYDLGMKEERFGKKTKEERMKVFKEVTESVPEIIEKLQPHEIARFLRSRDFDKEACIEMLKEHLKMIKEMGGYDLTKDWIKLGKPATTSRATRLGGFDKTGRLVIIKQAKYQYMPSLEDGSQGKYSRKWCLESEKGVLMHCYLAFYSPLEIFFRPKSMFLIGDFDGYGPYSQSKKAVTKECMKFFSGNMPECVHRLVMVNPFNGLTALSNFAKAFVDQETADKWHVYKKSRDLLKEIPMAFLETRYGGTHDDYPRLEDEKCDFLWLMEDLYEKMHQDETVGKIVELLKKTEKIGRYFDLPKLREEAKKAGLYQMKFPTLPNSRKAS